VYEVVLQAREILASEADGHAVSQLAGTLIAYCLIRITSGEKLIHFREFLRFEANERLSIGIALGTTLPVAGTGKSHPGEDHAEFNR
jgi:hypothetical protein